MKFAHLLVLLVSLLSWSLLAEVTPSYEVPKTKMQWKKNPRKADGDGIVMHCSDYGHFALLEEIDPNNKGAVEITVRLKGSRPHRELCDPAFKGQARKLPIGEGYFQGVRGKYIFVDGADGFGNQLTFEIFEVPSGKKVFQAVRDTSQDFEVKTVKGKTELKFFNALKVSCPLAESGLSCWEKILRDNSIPKTVSIAVPDCSASFQKANSPLSNSAIVTTSVVVRDLDKPRLTYLGGPASCTPAP